ncbi:(2Fe-2S)-binding protein [Denitrobaculum tricleocarpae]|uniref:(2Fe-2S)-binding protein n=1 Tax=Denitrobaculum tricleocarpae TaxID=2591009 RepID=A0A545SZC3_9PROT|nr:(2Fe-2S)-binding protein [Denitrobaculum tricleocarpae]TQV70325.1 (2Fe-2S)-binding protein [Denitrobaculum tricleocarpae]
MIRLNVNNEEIETDAEPDTALLWVLREHLGLTGTKFGCGAGMCGACTVHIDGTPSFSCLTSIDSLEGAKVTTIEGLSPDGGHPLQRAWVAEQVPQCGYCQSGQIMRAAALLAENDSPERAEILDYMSPNLCRCGTYNRIVKAVQRAAREV